MGRGEERTCVLFLSTSLPPLQIVRAGEGGREGGGRESFENLERFFSCPLYFRPNGRFSETMGRRDKKFTKHTSRARSGSRARAGQGTMVSLEVCRYGTASMGVVGGTRCVNVLVAFLRRENSSFLIYASVRFIGGQDVKARRMKGGGRFKAVPELRPEVKDRCLSVQVQG